MQQIITLYKYTRKIMKVTYTNFCKHTNYREDRNTGLRKTAKLSQVNFRLFSLHGHAI